MRIRISSKNPTAILLFFYWSAPQQMLRTHRSLEGLLCNPVMKMKFFLLFHFNGAPVEWNWQGKTEVLKGKPVPVPPCPPQIPHGPTWDRTRASARARHGLPQYLHSIVAGANMLTWPSQMPLQMWYKTALSANIRPGTLPFASLSLRLANAGLAVTDPHTLPLAVSHSPDVKTRIFMPTTMQYALMIYIKPAFRNR
jgi:hypothetical protein